VRKRTDRFFRETVFPDASGAEGGHVFDKVWSIVGQGCFSDGISTQMEREMCHWELNCRAIALTEFEDMVRKDFAGLDIPHIVLQKISKTAARHQSLCIAPHTSTRPIPR